MASLILVSSLSIHRDRAPQMLCLPPTISTIMMVLLLLCNALLSLSEASISVTFEYRRYRLSELPRLAYLHSTLRFHHSGWRNHRFHPIHQYCRGFTIYTGRNNVKKPFSFHHSHRIGKIPPKKSIILSHFTLI